MSVQHPVSHFTARQRRSMIAMVGTMLAVSVIFVQAPGAVEPTAGAPAATASDSDVATDVAADVATAATQREEKLTQQLVVQRGRSEKRLRAPSPILNNKPPL